MVVITDLDGTLRGSSYLFSMRDNGCLTHEQLDEMLLHCAAFPWVKSLCECLGDDEIISIITGEGTEHAEQVQEWVRRYLPGRPVHVQLLGDEIFFPPAPTDWNRYRSVKQQAYDDAIAMASARRKPGEWILVAEDDTKLVDYIIARHGRVFGLVVVRVGAEGRISLPHKNGSGAIDARWLRLARVIE